MSIEEVIDILQGIKDGTACLMKDMPRRGEIAIDMAINVLSKQQWVPCSERLPEVKQKVLVQYADGSMATKRCNDAGHLQWFYANAVAWMPAPEPYQPQKEINNDNR